MYWQRCQTVKYDLRLKRAYDRDLPDKTGTHSINVEVCGDVYFDEEVADNSFDVRLNHALHHKKYVWLHDRSFDVERAVTIGSSDINLYEDGPFFSEISGRFVDRCEKYGLMGAAGGFFLDVLVTD